MSKMTVVSLEGHIPVTSTSDPGPVFLMVKVNLEGIRGESWFALEHRDHMPRVGDVYEVTHGRMPEKSSSS